MPMLNGIEKVVENRAFGHHEQMLCFPQYFQKSSSTIMSIGVYMVMS